MRNLLLIIALALSSTAALADDADCQCSQPGQSCAGREQPDAGGSAAVTETQEQEVNEQ